MYEADTRTTHPPAGRMERAAALVARPVVHVTALALIAATLGLLGVSRVPLDGDPAMYATIARTIADTGEWMHLTFNGVPYLNKPPLHFWLSALVFKVAGATTFTALVMPGLLGVVCVLLVYALGRRTLGSWEAAFMAALVYTTTPEVMHWSRGVHLETLVTAWVLLGLLAAHRSVTTPSAVLWLGIAATGGFFAKGPQGLFPVLVALGLWAHAGVLRARVWSRWSGAALGIAVVTIGSWLGARLGEGSGFGQAYFEGQIGQVIFEGGELKRGSFWYVGKLLRTYWPWLPVALVGIGMLARRWRTSLGARLWLVYGAVVLVVISVAVGKKSRYLFQLYPALAAASGVALAAVVRRVPTLPVWMVGATAVATVAVVASGEHVSRSQRAHTAAALAVAADLPRDAPIWITNEVQYGEPQLGKIVGFYGPARLLTCRSDCNAEAQPGASVVARDHEADQVADALGADVIARHGILVVLKRPSRRDFR
ncbi:MAG: glycosyltransferase family 39 protein [Candidatus Binatia bacterium]